MMIIIKPDCQMDKMKMAGPDGLGILATINILNAVIDKLLKPVEEVENKK